MAAALPRFLEDRHTVAPASLARGTVASVEPSLATTTASTHGRVSAAVTVSPIRSASLYAGMTTATGGMRPILVGREVGDREDRVEPGHVKELPHCRPRRGQLELPAPLARLAQAG